MLFDYKIKGYVVNIWNIVNFQIDLDIPKNSYDIHSDTYLYRDEDSDVKEGIVYRCRLRGVKITNDNHDEYKELLTMITRRINKCNGFVIVRPYNIDNYHRLIVDLYDPITFENLTDIMLSKGLSVIDTYKK